MSYNGLMLNVLEVLPRLLCYAKKPGGPSRLIQTYIVQDAVWEKQACKNILALVAGENPSRCATAASQLLLSFALRLAYMWQIVQ